MKMLQKVKDRRKVLILSEKKEIENDICMILSSHGYSPDITEDFDEAREKILYYKPSLFLANIKLLPEFPSQLLSIFTKARKNPTFLLIDNGKHKEQLNKYIEYSDDILRIPFSDDNLYYKIKKAVSHNELIHDNQYYQGMFLMLKLMSPLFILLAFIITLNK
jgi:DNA-binding NtrC family response regulator